MIRPALLDVYAQQERLCKYFDMPMQHASDRLLRAMKRGYTQRTLYRLLEDIRQRMPEATIRSTFIVGFPGETPADVEELLRFLEQAQLDRVGVFTYSREEGTPSYALPEQVPAREAARRRRAVMTLQQEISQRKHQALVGRQLWALVDADATETQPAVGRLMSQAPDIDGVVSIDGPVSSGDLVLVEITAAKAYDFTARVKTLYPLSQPRQRAQQEELTIWTLSAKEIPMRPVRPVYIAAQAVTPFIGKGHPDFILKGHPDFGKRDNPTLEDHLVGVVRQVLAGVPDRPSSDPTGLCRQLRW